jgi:hypothetical protein
LGTCKKATAQVTPRNADSIQKKSEVVIKDNSRDMKQAIPWFQLC